jgi:3-phosphoinositide dependent protein kinase-1
MDLKKFHKKEMTEEEYFRDSLQKDSIFSNFENLNLREKLSFIIPNENPNEFKKSDFEILSELGRGSYSKVIKAKYLKDEKIKAIKVMDKDFMEKENKLYQIYLEADLLSKMNHDLIIKYDGRFSSGRKTYIVLEYIENSDLSEFLKIFGNFLLKKLYIFYYLFNNLKIKSNKIDILDIDLCKYYTAQIVNFLEYLNSNGIIHRDLKPENILLDQNYRLKFVNKI